MTIAIDFDGVVHAYGKGWKDGTIYDDFVKGSLFSLYLLMAKEPVFIFTTRSPRKVARWLERESGHQLECTTRLPRTWYGRVKPFWNTKGLLLVTNRKLAARAYIDDRAVKFTTWAEVLKDLGVDNGGSQDLQGS